MREGQILYTYLHLAAAPELAQELLKRGVTGVAYETIELDDGAPAAAAADVGGRRPHGHPGRRRPTSRRSAAARASSSAACPACAAAAWPSSAAASSARTRRAWPSASARKVNILDINPDTLAYLDDIYQGRVNTLYSDPLSIEESVHARRRRRRRGARRRRASAPRLVTEDDDQEDGAGLGDRRRRGRPGRLHRDLPPHHPRRPDLHRPRRHPLLRGQHAGRGRAHLDLRAQQRHPGLRRQDRRPGHRGGGRRRPCSSPKASTPTRARSRTRQ